MFGSTERRLGIDNPILLEQGAQESRKGFLLRQRQTYSMKDELVSLKGLPQARNELAAKDTA
jgi:hypothetical protein